MVGTGMKQPVTGGAIRPAGGVPTGGTLENGEPSGGVGAGEGAGVGEQLPTTGRGAGAAATGGRGAAGTAGAGEQQPDYGKNKRGGPSTGEAGSSEKGSDSGRGSEAELGGLSDLDLDSIFDELGKAEKVKGNPRALSGAPKAPKSPTFKGKSVIPKDLEGLGLEALLDELEVALNAKKPKKTNYSKNKFKTVIVDGKSWWVPENNSQLLAVQINHAEEYKHAIIWKMSTLAEEWGGLESALASANHYLRQEGATYLPQPADEEQLVQFVLENNSRIMEKINAGDPAVSKPADPGEAKFTVENQELNWEDFLT